MADADITHPHSFTLQVGGVTSPKSRYRLVWPENHARLPIYMSTAAMLMASPRQVFVFLQLSKLGVEVGWGYGLTTAAH